MRFRILFLILFLLAAAAGLGYGFLVWELNRPIADSGKVELTISSGESVQEIGVKLQEAGVMNSLLFVFYVRSKNLTAKIQAGKYEIPLTLAPVQVVELLQHGTFDIRLTFLDGWRKEEYLRYALEKLAVDDNDFSAQFLVETKNLEGHLFPDTYTMPIDIGATALVGLLNQTFENRYEASIRPLQSQSGLTKEQIVILASLLERESVGNAAELETIAGILVKRLKAGWYLGVDATVQYALGYQEAAKSWWKRKLTSADLATASPYNTYTRLGLPPAPIANPGIATLSAAASYSRTTPYWYYLHCKDGKVRYSKTLAEHTANQACIK